MAGSSTFTPYHVLVAFDDDVLRATTRTLLEQNGHHVTSADDHDGAQKLMLDTRFDCALVDVVPPDFTGLRILGLVRRSVRYRGLPVGVITPRPETIISLLRATQLTEDVLLARPEPADIAQALEILAKAAPTPTLQPLAKANLRDAADLTRPVRTVVVAL